MSFLKRILGGSERPSGYTPTSDETKLETAKLPATESQDVVTEVEPTLAPEDTMSVQGLRDLAATLTKYEQELGDKGISAENIRTTLTVLKQLAEIKHSEQQKKLQESPLNKLLEIADALPDDVKTKIDRMVSEIKKAIVQDIIKIRSKALAEGESITLEEAARRKKDLVGGRWFRFSLSLDTGLKPLELYNPQSVNEVLTTLIGYDLNTLMQSKNWTGKGANIDSVLLPGLRVNVLDRQAMSQRDNFGVDIYLELAAVGTLDPDHSGLKLIVDQAFREYQDQQAS